MDDRIIAGDRCPTTGEYKLDGEAAPLFRCDLEAQPDHLAPKWQIAALAQMPARDDLVLSPAVRFGPSGAPEVANDAIYQDNWTAWTTDPGAGLTVPFVLSARLFEAAENSARRSAHPPESIQRLWWSGVLVAKNDLERRQLGWSHRVAKARRMFDCMEFATLRDFLHPFQLAAMRRYFRYQVRRGAFALGDIQSSLRYVVHNDPVATFFHQQLGGAVSDVVGYSVKPSYVYLGAYQPGAQLPRHTDRRQCEITMAVCIDYSPEPQKETSWPLQLETEFARIGVYQALGDGLIYPGARIPHLRDVLPDRCSSTSLFFHFVSVDYHGPLD